MFSCNVVAADILLSFKEDCSDRLGSFFRTRGMLGRKQSVFLSFHARVGAWIEAWSGCVEINSPRAYASCFNGPFQSLSNRACVCVGVSPSLVRSASVWDNECIDEASEGREWAVEQRRSVGNPMCWKMETEDDGG